jgi:hypothetical protein
VRYPKANVLKKVIDLQDMSNRKASIEAKDQQRAVIEFLLLERLLGETT